MVITAGMCHGTPDWQLGRAYEAETAKDLEKAYASDDFPVIASKLNSASTLINQAISILCRAADLADQHGKAEPIDRLIERLEDIHSDMDAESEKLQGR